MKNKPTVYFIVGNKKNINMTNLAKYGKLVQVKEKTLFSK